MINESIEKIFAAELQDGEELIWAQRPSKHSFILLISGFSLLFVFCLVFLIPGAIAVLKNDPSGLAFDFNGQSVSQINNTTLLIPSLIFSAIFSTFYCWLCYYGSKRIGHSIFAVTNLRVLISRPNWPDKTLKLNPREYDLDLQGNDKVGTIFFKKKTMSPILKIFAPTGSFVHPVFFKIKNPKAVEALIHQQFLSGGAG